MISHQPCFCPFFFPAGRGGGDAGVKDEAVGSTESSRLFSNSFLSLSSCTLFSKNVLNGKKTWLYSSIFRDTTHSCGLVLDNEIDNAMWKISSSFFEGGA